LNLHKKMRIVTVFSLLFILLGSSVHAREVIPFNKDWAFKKGPFTTDPMTYNRIFQGKWQLVQIPHTWNARDMQVHETRVGTFRTNERFYTGDAYYRKSFTPNATWKDKRVFIK